MNQNNWFANLKKWALIKGLNIQRGIKSNGNFSFTSKVSHSYLGIKSVLIGGLKLKSGGVKSGLIFQKIRKYFSIV